MGKSSYRNHAFARDLSQPGWADALRFGPAVREVRQEPCRSVWRAEEEACESW